MRCPSCGFESPAGMKCCGQCAIPLTGACPQCDLANPTEFAFCGQCAAPLTDTPAMAAPSLQLAEKILPSKAALEGERKQVTVLFADFKGSMELLADRDPEEARTILDPVLARIMAGVHRYEGTVNRVMGDGIMALFGAPIAHEGHAVRAWRPYWRPISEEAKPFFWPRRRSPALSRPATVPKASAPMRRRASGGGGSMEWRSSTRYSTRWYAPASTPSSKCHVRVTQKNPEVIPTFKASCYNRLQRAIPPANTRPVHVFSQAESRFRLLTIRLQRLTIRGVQPIGHVQHVFEWLSMYGAVGHTTGRRFFLGLPSLNAEMFLLFVDAFTQAFRDSLNLLLLDNSGAPTAQRLTLPENVRLVFLPPYCPELTPIEPVWRDLKDALAQLQFPHLDG
jgi:transposase